MNIAIMIKLKNMPNDTDLGTVDSVVRRQLAEWLDLDKHPEDMEVLVGKNNDDSIAS